MTKKAALTGLETAQPKSYFGDIFRFQYTENTGAMLGLGSSLPQEVRVWTLVILNGLMLFGLLWFVIRSKEITLPGVLGSALMIAGGFGNILDRVLNDGKVIDFMNIGIGSLRTGIFNIADLAIMSGVGLIVLWVLRARQIES